MAATAPAATEKQMAFINRLRDEALRRLCHELNHNLVMGADARARVILRAAFVVAAPAPETVAAASARIDALKDGATGMLALGEREGWGERIAAQVVARLGEDHTRWLSQLERDGDWITPDSLRRTFA